MKFTLPHWLIALFVLLGTIGPQVAGAFPTIAPEVNLFDQLVPIILGYLGVTSISALKGKQGPPSLPLVGGALLLGVLSVGCLSPQPIPAQVAAGESVFSCVEQNWGQPVAQVVAACLPAQGALGED